MPFAAADRPVTQSDARMLAKKVIKMKATASDCESIERLNAKKELAEFLSTDVNGLLSIFNLSQSEVIMNI